MKCPIHNNINLKPAIFNNIETDYCPTCLGIWLEEGEFRIAKDTKEKNLDWIDFDLWSDKKRFQISKDKKTCPACEVPMYEISYGDSDIRVDICDLCMGIWLDRGEFKKVIRYLREKSSQEILNNYTKSLLKETGEVFTGPESLEEEIADVVTVVGLLKHKISAKYPTIAEIISSLPRG